MDPVRVLLETNMVLTLLEEHLYQPPLRFVQSVHTDSAEPVWATAQAPELVLEPVIPLVLMLFMPVHPSVALYSAMLLLTK
jgi:hypothetical protein